MKLTFSQAEQLLPFLAKIIEQNKGKFEQEKRQAVNTTYQAYKDRATKAASDYERYNVELAQFIEDHKEWL